MAINSKRQLVDFRVMACIIVVLVVPFAITLLTITDPRTPLDPQTNPSPHGYTLSLSLFIVPVLVLAIWLSRRREKRLQLRAFGITTLIVSCGGVFLDTFFGATFFTFPNSGAVLGVYFPGFSLAGGWHNKIPIEEAGFYIFGALAIMLVYIWGDEFWFGAYNVDDGPRHKTRLRDIVSFHPASAIFGMVVFLAGLAYKKLVPHADQAGFPGYFLFLILVAIIPSILFFPVASPYINWRAFSLGTLFILLVSLFWEATIAVPYQWWGFRPSQMLGLFINGFSGLPIEEPLLWLGITWFTVITYETISTLLFMRGNK
jgi:hypothetical protein